MHIAPDESYPSNTINGEDGCKKILNNEKHTKVVAARYGWIDLDKHGCILHMTFDSIQGCDG